jgi:hypothetical protein
MYSDDSRVLAENDRKVGKFVLPLCCQQPSEIARSQCTRKSNYGNFKPFPVVRYLIVFLCVSRITLHHPNILNLYGACLEATMVDRLRIPVILPIDLLYSHSSLCNTVNLETSVTTYEHTPMQIERTWYGAEYTFLTLRTHTMFFSAMMLWQAWVTCTIGRSYTQISKE